MTPEDLELLAQATKAARESAAKGGRWTQIPGQVQDFDPTSGLCAVRLDGDTTTMQGVPNLSSSWPYLGERVMVTFVPPQGVFVTAVIRPVGPPNIKVSSSAVQTVNGGPFRLNNVDTLESGHFEFFELAIEGSDVAIQCNLSGHMRVSATVQGTSGATAGRRFLGLTQNGVTTRLGLSDTSMSAVQQWIAGGSKKLLIQAGDLIGLRALSAASIDVIVDEWAIEWIDRPSIWEGV